MSENIKKRANLKKEEIIDTLIFLKKSLPKNPTVLNKLYVYPNLINDHIIYDDNLVVHLQAIAENMNHFLSLISGVKVFYIDSGLDRLNKSRNIFMCNSNGTISKFENEKDYAGLYSNHSACETITIVKETGYKLIHLVGILAHEMTHKYLNFHNIKKNNTLENEILTDLATIYLGFGHLLLASYRDITYITNYVKKEDTTSYTEHTRSIGYISFKSIIRALIITCKLRQWKPKDVISNIYASSDRSLISRRLLSYRIELFRNNIYDRFVKFNKNSKYFKNLNINKKLDEINKKYCNTFNLFNLIIKSDYKKLLKEEGNFLVELSNEIQTQRIKIEIMNALNMIKNNIELKKKIHKALLKNLDRIESKVNNWHLEILKIHNKYFTII